MCSSLGRTYVFVPGADTWICPYPKLLKRSRPSVFSHQKERGLKTEAPLLSRSFPLQAREK